MTEAPALLRSLEAASSHHPVDPKLLLCRTIGEGRELLRAVAARGVSWLGWEVSTPSRLALRIAAPDLARRGLAVADDFDQEAGVDLALEAALDRRRGHALAALGETPGFRQAVAGAVRELRLAGIDATRLRAAPASTPAVRDLLADVLDAYAAWLADGGRAGLDDVMRWAATRVTEEGGQVLGGQLVFLAPGLPLAGAAGALVRALRDAGADALRADPVTVDAPAGTLWDPAPEPAPLTALFDDVVPAEDPGLALFAASGPADEIREVLRRVVAAGLPWDQVEIVATDPVVYGGALHALAQRLHVPVSFAVGLPVERTRTGRAAAAWFRWIQEGFPAVEIRRLLEQGDLRPSGYTRSTTRLARRLRRMRVGWGHGRYLPAIDRALAALEGPPRPRHLETADEAAERAARDREDLRALRDLLAPLLEVTPPLDLADPDARVAPAEIAAALRRFLEFVPAADSPSATARERFMAITDRIGARLTTPMAPAAALAALRRHLRIRVPAPDREGAAPWVSSGGYLHLSDVEHGGLTGRPHTFVVGLDAERFPGAGLQDPMLPDALRRALDPVALPSSADRLAAHRFDLAATLARLRGRVTLSWSAWDPVQAREIAPAPVLLHAFRIARRSPHASFEEMVRDLGDAASAVPRAGLLDQADLWLDALSRDGILLDGQGAVRDAFPALAAGSDALAALAGDVATPHHGLVRPRPGLDPRRDPDFVLSASALEALGTCGLRFLYRSVLRIRPPEDPELDPDRWLDALQRGSLLHAVYERTLREARDRGLRAGDDAFTDHALAVLDAEAAAFRDEVPPPGTAVFEREMAMLREDVRSFAAMVDGADDRWVALEMRFGFGGEPPAELPVGGGTLRLRGAIDRVDRTPDGDLVVVDYKTGASKRHERGKDLYRGGRRLQNVIYPAIAERLLEATVARMEYHFPTRTGQNEVIAYERHESRAGLGLIGRLLDMAAAGRFLPTPDGGDCLFCDYKAICRHTAQGFSTHTPLADWAAARWGSLEEFAELRAVRAWAEAPPLHGLDDDA